MATEDQSISARRAANSGTFYVRGGQRVVLTVAGNTVVKQQITVPAGATRPSVSIETPTDISGTPTTCNVRVGTTDTGQEVVADVDAKAQGHIAATIVTALNRAAALTAQTIYYAQVTTAGGTSAAGPITVFFDYDPGIF